MVRSVKSLIKRIMHHAPRVAWHKVLPIIMLAINSTVARSTGVAPQEVFYGEVARGLWQDWTRETSLPAELGEVTAAQLKEYAAKLSQKIKGIKE